MALPKGMRCVERTINEADQVLIYSDVDRIVLQLRHQRPTEENVLEPAYKTAVLLNPVDAIALACELLATVKSHLPHLYSDTTPRPGAAQKTGQSAHQKKRKRVKAKAKKVGTPTQATASTPKSHAASKESLVPKVS